MDLSAIKTSVAQPEHIQTPTAKTAPPAKTESPPTGTKIETIDLRSKQPVELFLTGWGYEKAFTEGWRRLECYPIVNERVFYIVYGRFGVCETYVMKPARWKGRKTASDHIAVDRGFDPEEGSEIALSLSGERTEDEGVHESYTVPGGTETLHIHQTETGRIGVLMEADYLPF